MTDGATAPAGAPASTPEGGGPVRPDGRGCGKPRSRARRAMFALVAVLGTALLAAALLGAVGWMLRPVATADSFATYGLLQTISHDRSNIRIEWPEHPAGSFVYNARSPHYRRPWHVPKARPSDVPRRVLMLGDSHLHGVCDTRDNMTALLDTALSPTQVVNCGVFGWSPLDELRYYRDELQAWQFDDVVLVIFSGNDLSELYRPGKARLVRDAAADGGWREETTDAAPAPHAGALGVVLWRLGLRRPDALPPPEARALRAKAMAYVSPGAMDQGGFQTMYFQDQPEAHADAMGMLRHVVEQMREIATARGARFRVVLMPTKNMIEPGSIADIREDVVRLLGVRPENLDADARAHEQIHAMVGDLGIEMLDMAPVLRAAAGAAPPSNPMFWRTDFHLSIFGHAAAAEALRPWL